jgi:hypothetical protein
MSHGIDGSQEMPSLGPSRLLSCVLQIKVWVLGLGTML